jgi:hypothetical protein
MACTTKMANSHRSVSSTERATDSNLQWLLQDYGAFFGLGQAFPSHGRGRRFNPYSAHQRLPNKSNTFACLESAPIDNSQQNAARTCANDPGKIRGICSMDVHTSVEGETVSSRTQIVWQVYILGGRETLGFLFSGISIGARRTPGSSHRRT